MAQFHRHDHGPDGADLHLAQPADIKQPDFVGNGKRVGGQEEGNELLHGFPKPERSSEGSRHEGGESDPGVIAHDHHEQARGQKGDQKRE